MLRSKAASARMPKRSDCAPSWPNAFTTRMPAMLSSAVWVTSPTFCCTSTSTGCDRLLARAATSTSAGPISSASTVSGTLMNSSTTVTNTRVKACMNRKIRPYPRKNRTVCRSLVARDINWPTGMRSKYPNDRRCRCANTLSLRSNSTDRLTWPARIRRITANSARMTPITMTMSTSGSRASSCCPFRTSSITRRVRYGRVIVQAISARAEMAVMATDHL